MLVVVAPFGGVKGTKLSVVITRQSTVAFGRILVCMLARFALGNLEPSFVEALYLTATCSVSGYCPVEYGTLALLGDDLTGSYWVRGCT